MKVEQTWTPGRLHLFPLKPNLSWWIFISLCMKKAPYFSRRGTPFLSASTLTPPSTFQYVLLSFSELYFQINSYGQWIFCTCSWSLSTRPRTPCLVTVLLSNMWENIFILSEEKGSPLTDPIQPLSLVPLSQNKLRRIATILIYRTTVVTCPWKHKSIWKFHLTHS